MPKAESTVLVPPSKCKPPKTDLTGKKFGRLTVVAYAGQRITSKKASFPYWDCQCECGGRVTAYAPHIKRGKIQSCGCLRAETTRSSKTKHGGSAAGGVIEYTAWIHMKGRCYNPNNAKYPRYGARGIKVCARWLNDFQAFVEDMGFRPLEKTSIHRINNDGDYEPGNCVWADDTEQARVRSTSAFYSDMQGRVMLRVEWSQFCFSPQRVSTMIKKGHLIKVSNPHHNSDV